MGNDVSRPADESPSDSPQGPDEPSLTDIAACAEGQTGADGKDASNIQRIPPPANSQLLWDPTPFEFSVAAGEASRCQSLPLWALIPSPLATLGSGEETELTYTVDETVAGGVRDLWHACVNTREDSPPGRNFIRRAIEKGHSEANGGKGIGDNHVGFVAWIEKAPALEKDDMQDSEDETDDRTTDQPTAMLRYSWVINQGPIALKASGSEQQCTASGQQIIALDIRRSRRTDQVIGHFVVHSSQATLRINGIRIPTGAVAGPLPTFAVIEIGDIAVFWWRDLESLDYLPEKRPKNSLKRSRGLDPGDEFENFNDDEPPLQKRSKVLKKPSNFGAPRRSARIASQQAVKHAVSSNASGIGLNLPKRFPTPPPRALKGTKAGPSGGRKSHPRPGTRSADTGGLPNKPPVVSVTNDPRTWTEELERRLTFWKEESQRVQGDVVSYEVKSYDSLNDDDAVLAIASVWLPLINWGTNFAFGEATLFQTNRLDNSVGPRCVLSPNPFVMPLIFSRGVDNPPEERQEYHKRRPSPKPAGELEKARKIEEREAYGRHVDAVNKTLKTSILTKMRPKTEGEKKNLEEKKKAWRVQEGINYGHFTLAVAERVPYTTDSVRLKFWDSSPGHVSRDLIRGTARNLVRNCHWMPSSVWPRFVEEEEHWLRSPQQSGHSCGLHVVLNAWAYMLNISVNQKAPVLRGEFYDDALVIINLALQGCMDARTIRAFFHHHGYAAPRSFRDVSEMEASTRPDQPGDMRHLPQTARMNENILKHAISRLETLGARQSAARDAAARDSAARDSHRLVPPRAPDPPDPTPDPTAGIQTLEKSSPPNSGAPAAPGSFNTWEQLLKDGLKQARQKAEESGRTDYFSIRKNENNALDDDEVGFAIASIWLGLRRDIGKEFGFGTPNTFQMHRTAANRDAGQMAVGNMRPLIIPLFLSDKEHLPKPNKKPEKGGKKGGKGGEVGGVGHFILAVAERTNSDVTLTFMDSRPGTRSASEITAAAEGIVTYSGWMGVTATGTPIASTPIFTPQVIQQVPHQTGWNNCGFHVVLNAWAYMLSIPIEASGQRRRTAACIRDSHGAEFYRLGKEIMNLALRGAMDSRTIQAFLNVYGYARAQDINSENDYPLLANAAEMSSAILQEVMTELRDEQQISALE